MLWTLDQCPVPVIGRVHGDCYAGGMGLVYRAYDPRLRREVAIKAMQIGIGADLERRLDSVSRDIAEQRHDGRGCR